MAAPETARVTTARLIGLAMVDDPQHHFNENVFIIIVMFMLLMINPIDVVNETLPYDTTAHFYLFFACVFIKYLLCEGLQVMGNTDNE